MKTTENKSTIALVERLSEIIEAKKHLEKAERDIKADLKAIMSDLGVQALGAGGYVMIISDRVRTELDKEMVKAALGIRYNEFLKKSEYQIFEVKKA